MQNVPLIKRKPAVLVGNSCWEQTASGKERKFARNKRKQLKVGTEIETGLQIVRGTQTSLRRSFLSECHMVSTHTRKCHCT